MDLNFCSITILAGIMATYGLLIMALWAHRLGLPRLDFARAMTNFTYGASFDDDGQGPYWAGQVLIYMNGVFFALLYATVIAQYLPGTPMVKGVIWGVLLWVVSGLFFVPLFLREGFFLSHIDSKAWMSSLMVHGVYGLIIGWLSPILQSGA
jgi:hypothetical protein